jgi:hypothetical protein
VTKAKPFIPPQMEVRTDDGTTFIATSQILRDPDLQARCVEKRELQRIMKILRKEAADKPIPPKGQRMPRKRKLR